MRGREGLGHSPDRVRSSLEGEVEKAADEVERVRGASLGDRGNDTGVAEVEKKIDLRMGSSQLRPMRMETSSAPDRIVEENLRDVQRTGNPRETHDAMDVDAISFGKECKMSKEGREGGLTEEE